MDSENPQLLGIFNILDDFCGRPNTDAGLLSKFKK